MNNEEKDFQESNIDPEKLSQSINDFVNSENSIKANSNKISDEARTKISKIINFIKERYEVRYNTVLNILEVKEIGVDEKFKRAERFENDLSVELFSAGFKGFKSELLAYLGSSHIQHYHPIKDYFENLTAWDKVDRIEQYINCLRCENKIDEKSIYTCFKKHLVRCVATVFKEGYFNKHCFVIVGTKQNMGKTSFIRYLVPTFLKSYSTDAILDWKDKDAEIALGSNWIINLDELANLDKQETNSLKSILSRNMIKVRRHFGKDVSEIPRLANFFGSTNDLQFLSDLTGNVRWICFNISFIDFSYNKIDMDQLWAQAYYEFINGFNYEMTREEVLENEERNMEFMVINPERDAIINHFIPASKNEIHPQLLTPSKFAAAGELMRDLNLKGYSFKSIANFGKALSSCGFKRVSERSPFKLYPTYGYWYFEIDISDPQNFEPVL